MDSFLVTYHATINISHCKLKISFVVNVAVRVATCCTKCISILHSPQLVSVINTGNPKTLSPRSTDPHYVPGPRTSSMDPSVDHPPNKIKHKNKDLTYCCVGEISSVTLGKCDRLGFSLGHKLCHRRSLHNCHFLCCGFAWKTGKPLKFVIFSLCHFLWFPLLRVQGLLLAFTLILSSHNFAIMDE